MGFLTRLIAGLTAAAALGAGLTGTANAVDVTGATGTTKSVVKLTADDTNNLPDHIVNGSFDYPSVPSWTGLAGSSSNKNNKGKRFATINPGTGKYGSGCAMSTTGRAIPNWNRSSFAWNSTQGDAHYPGMSCEAGNVELNYDSVHHNQFAELTADQQGTAIYQDVKVTPGTMMTWSLKHSSATSAYVDKMQVMIGEPYKETAQEATRIASENGNKVGEKMTTISTPTTSDRADSKKWDTYSGTYLVPDGVTTVRFTFKSVASAEWYSGNDLDDIEFFRSYKLTYDKNSADASGQVPSNQRGKENTTQPAKTKTKTNGKIRLTSDDTSGLPDHLVNGDFSVNYKDQWLTGGWNWTSITPDGKYLNSVRNWNDSATTWKTVNGWDKTKFGWSSTQKDGTDDIQHKAGAVEIQYDDQADNVYAELCAYEAGTAIYQDIKTVPGTLYKVRLKHASLYDGYLDKMQVMIGAPGHEQPVEMTRTGVNGNGDRLNEKSSIIATKVSNTGENDRNHDSQWESYEGTYLIPAGQTVTRFTFRSVGSRNLDHGNLLDDIVFDKAYRLDYDKNSNEAAGSVPSNQRGKENTTQPAKTKTNGTVKTVADTNASLPDHLVNVEFTYADTGEKVPDTFKGVTGFNDLDGWDAQSGLKFEGVQLLSGFNGAYKRSDAELGTYGTNGFAGIGHDAGDEAHLNAPQQSRHRLAATWTGSTFTFSYDLSNPAGRTDGSRMTFGAPVTRTAVLTYDRNASDATGQVPSNTTPDTTQTASSKSTGKVSDLVQRTTTHEDGSVTVRTIDTSTDVVSGCQVYYPAGQRITLATMAKDDDCWDSSMLSRPGHTQLGWNQDRNATQAQAQVTMVEGGMTVYAVWVGNPVLTYDTNKPNTWTGQMPSTPASVSVPYNAPAADGSGWRAGDVSKIRGYRFLGWYTTPQDNAGLYDWTRPLTGSVTVYAHWQRLQANVIYDKNASDATGSHANTTGWQYSDVTIPGDTSKSFTRDGYVFKGWSLKAGKADVVYKDGSQIPLQDKDITLYAQWQGIHENFTETGGISLPLLIAGGIGLLVMGVGSTVMLTRRMNGHGMPDGE